MDTFTILDETISQLIMGDEPTHINFYNSFDVQEEFENIENQKSYRFILGEDFDRLSSELYSLLTQVRRDEKINQLFS